MKVGFTGTRNGCTQPQRATLRLLLELLNPSEFHYGAAKGADAEAYWLAAPLGVLTVAYPGMDSAGSHPDEDQPSVANAGKVLPRMQYFARNRAIVDAVELMVACPPCFPLPLQGGTVYTIKYAVGRKVVIIVKPDGELETLVTRGWV